LIDLFEFWGRIKPSATIHPSDKPVFDRLRGQHGFNLNCLPKPYSGPLKTARVVLLYLSPGFSPQDLKDAKSKAGQRHYVEQRSGEADLPVDSTMAGHSWRMSRLAFLGEWQNYREQIAVLDIGAYHSKNFTDHDVLASLPSSRVTLDWAQQTLFPEAEAGKRVVICMRAAKYWGLRAGQTYGKSLFAPDTGRSGHMNSGIQREQIIRAARRALAES
jgi:hypothetical protein